MSKVLLDLDTLVDRPKITIDGKPYEILAPGELTVLTSHSLASKGKRMEALMNQDELSEGEQAELTSAVRDISDTIMSPIPTEIRDKLADPQRVAVIEAFSTLLLTNKAGTAAAMLRSLLPVVPGPTGKRKSTGVKRSRGSSASTAARPAGGSAKRRSRS